jgi:hypothetical protein
MNSKITNSDNTNNYDKKGNGMANVISFTTGEPVTGLREQPEDTAVELIEYLYAHRNQISKILVGWLEVGSGEAQVFTEGSNMSDWDLQALKSYVAKHDQEGDPDADLDDEVEGS